MATPTPIKHALPQQGRTPSQLAGATPPTSTPFSNPAQAAFSPRGPRSSPQQVKKSPAMTTNLMGQSATGAFNFDSPSTAAAMGALVSGGFDLGLDGVSAGALDSLVAYGSEDDKLKRLDAILKLLNQKKGFVSEAGLERLARRLGLELLSEEHATPGGRKTKTLAMAGSAISLDIVLDNNVVQGVSLAYHGSAPSVSRHMGAASHILLKDLQLAPDQSPLTKTLDEFASNLEQIATLDKLSVVPGLDCYEALAGIHISLERLFQWDLSQLRQEPGMGDSKSGEHLALAAMCTRHGHPVMHARGKVGLALQYWRELRLAPPANKRMAEFCERQESVWSLRLGCAPMDALGLPPIRVSEDWISKEVVKPSLDAAKPMLDWLEPDNVSLPPSEESKSAEMEVLQLDVLSTLPRVMFTVTFDPPVILPQNDWIRVYAYADASPPNPNGTGEFGPRSPPTFDSLFFPVPFGSKQVPSESRTITRLRDVRVFDRAGGSSIRRHRNTLFIYKPIYSQEVTEMPFSHPRQLIDMLPLLRQFAFLTTLLRNSFGGKTEEVGGAGRGKGDTCTTRERLGGFLNVGAGGSVVPGEELDLDVTLWVHPAPHLQVVFPTAGETVNITLRVVEGGSVEIVHENVLGRREGMTREDLGRGLEYFEDVCKWAEWIRGMV